MFAPRARGRDNRLDAAAGVADDPAMVAEPEHVAIDSAAAIAGIPARTLRYWIATGKLAATGGKRGRLVRLADVRHLAEITGRAGPTTDGNGNDCHDLPADPAIAVAGNVAGAAALAAIERQLADYREMIERLHAENVSLAGQLGHALGELEAARQAIRQLSAPTNNPATVAGLSGSSATIADEGEQAAIVAAWPTNKSVTNADLSDQAPTPAKLAEVNDQPPVETPQPTPDPASADVRASERPLRTWWKRWLGWATQPV